MNKWRRYWNSTNEGKFLIAIKATLASIQSIEIKYNLVLNAVKFNVFRFDFGSFKYKINQMFDW